MNIQNLMKLAAQNAEEVRKAQEANRVRDTCQLLILATTINDLVGEDAIDKTLQRSTDKVVKKFVSDEALNEDDKEVNKAIANLAKTEAKAILNNTAEIMRVKS